MEDEGKRDRRVRDALGEVVCPCSAGLGRPFSVTEMDIVRDVVTTEAATSVVVELTDPTCVFGLSIADSIERRLHEVLGDDRQVNVTFAVIDEPWSEDRLTPSAAERLAAIRRGDRRASGALQLAVDHGGH